MPAKKIRNLKSGAIKQPMLLYIKPAHFQKNKKVKLRFANWGNEIMEKEVKQFYTVANTVKHNLDNILNFFINRNTNANAESFNSKIKLFRASQGGVVGCISNCR